MQLLRLALALRVHACVATGSVCRLAQNLLHTHICNTNCILYYCVQGGVDEW